MEPANQQTCKQGKQFAPIYKSNNGPQEPWMFLKLYLSLVSPILKYGSLLEKLQSRAYRYASRNISRDMSMKST